MTKLKNRRLLVVDYQVDTLDLLQIAFEAEGATVVTTTSALDALIRLDQEEFHGLLCEIVLPYLDGCDLLRRAKIQAVQKRINVPAIALTGFVTQTIRQDIQAAGYARYFLKPVDLDELIDAMSALTQSSASSIPAYTCHKS